VETIRDHSSNFLIIDHDAKAAIPFQTQNILAVCF